MKTLTEKAEAIADEFFKTIPNQSVYTTTSLIEFVYKKAISDAAEHVAACPSFKKRDDLVAEIKKLGEL
jgi:hypothetical protein